MRWAGPWMALALCSGVFGGAVHAQNPPQGVGARSPSFQLEHFEPLGDPTVNIVNVPGPEVRAHLSTAAGLVCHHTHQPVILVPPGGEQLEALESQSRCEVVGALGLFGVASLNFALPVVVHQSAPAPDIFNLQSSDFDGVVAGDFRIVPKVQLFRPVAGFSAAVATPLYFATGDGTTFNSGGGLRMEPQLIVGWRKRLWQVAGSVGHQLQNPMRLHNIVLDDATRWRLGARAPLGWRGLRAFAVAFGSISSGESRDPDDLTLVADDDRGSPAEALGGLEYAFQNGMSVRLGGGRAISRGLGAPTWRGMASVDWAGGGQAFEPGPWGGRGPSARWRLLLRAPAFTGVGPFAFRRRAVQSPEAVYSVDSGQIGEQADLTFTLEVGQAAVHPSDEVEAMMVGVGVAVAILDDLELSVEIPSIFAEQDELRGPVVRPQRMRGDGMAQSQSALSAGGIASGDESALGDIALRLKALAVDGAEHPFGAGLVIPILLPTGTTDAVSTGRLRLGTVGVGEVHLAQTDVRANLGVHIEDELDRAQPLQAIVETGLGATWHLQHDWQVGAEAFGEYPLDDFEDPRLYGGAGLVGQITPSGFSWEVGAKVTRYAAEITQVDLLLRLTWGVEAALDVHHTLPVKPPPVVQAPPVITPPVVLDEDEDGITEGDQCPKVPEDHDGYQDTDGCPEPDNDADGVLDHEDRCPNSVGIRQWDGCNDINITVEFPFKSVTPSDNARAVLEEMVTIIQSNPQIVGITVEGHTDDVGTEALNMQLSTARANAVRRLLIESGISPDWVRAVGYGETRPRVAIEGLSDEALQRARDQNRRVRFVLKLNTFQSEPQP
ncbi:MAG: OmpA family protein [Bradymonadia bacterium]